MQIETNINTEAHTVITGTPTKDHPAGFRINPDGSTTYQPKPKHDPEAPHLMDKAMSADRLKEYAGDLVEARRKWEEGAYRASNAELFKLLASCLALYLHLKSYDDARKEFHDMYKKRGLASTKSTSLITKIVRYVFGDKAEKRTFAYAKVIEVAFEKNVVPEGFASFVAAEGGIEEIRRNGADAQEKAKQREEAIEKARITLKTKKPLAEKLPAPRDLKVEGQTNFVAVIARMEADRTLSLLHFTANETLVEALLAQAARDGVTEKEENTSYVRSREDVVNQ